jgi:hypothetical protein
MKEPFGSALAFALGVTLAAVGVLAVARLFGVA